MPGQREVQGKRVAQKIDNYYLVSVMRWTYWYIYGKWSGIK